ncbi:DUF1871 family protein [Bacillus sp. CLL-7-23]|uniref:DUF1871 family protein n=1 Tax=Bacillus changyiensis TaxID=3004103 RepID=A0ABT4X726_9BACI|nr:DUF1871 family protein [Bacillus changyiensis]MDA7028074.1 DUF1871 family protein [Bacillus changyiensis]
MEEMIQLIKKWDPFEIGPDGYETEAAEIVQFVYAEDNAEQLGQSIHTIFDLSFDQSLALRDCIQLAEQLLIIKNASSC